MELDPNTAHAQAIEELKNIANSAEHSKCPCCGEMTLPKIPKISDALMEHYMSCVLAGEPFWKEYPLYGGKVRITVTILAPHVRVAVHTLNTALRTLATTLPDSSKTKVGAVINCIANAVQIRKITVAKSIGAPEVYMPGKTVLDALDELTKEAEALETAEDGAKAAFIDKLHKMYITDTNLIVLPESVVLLALSSHIQVDALLTGVGFDQSFWEGIELA